MTLKELEALAEQPAQQCRTDGRCQYAIDSGAEGMGHCPKGKCIMPAQQQEPDAFADKIAFEEAMKSGKGCDVWPTASDYEARTGRTLIALYTSPPASKPLTDERIFELASEHQDWDRNLIRVRSFARAIESAHGIKGQP